MTDAPKQAPRRKAATQRHPLAEEFGLYLKELRKGRDLSQSELAFDAGTDRTYISMLERGLSAPSLLVMDALSKALKMTLTDLVTGLDAAVQKSRRRKAVPRRKNEASLALKERHGERPKGNRRSPLR